MCSATLVAFRVPEDYEREPSVYSGYDIAVALFKIVGGRYDACNTPISISDGVDKSPIDSMCDVWGFPEEHIFSMMGMRGKIVEHTAGKVGAIGYDVDRSGGQSGSPAAVVTDSNHTIIGVHVAGCTGLEGYNVATLITPWTRQWMEKSKNKMLADVR